MEININHEAVNKLVADAILKSAIGDAVEKAIAREIKAITTTYNNPIDSVIRGHVVDIIRETLIKDHSDALKNKIREAVAQKISGDFIDRVCEKALEKF